MRAHSSYRYCFKFQRFNLGCVMCQSIKHAQHPQQCHRPSHTISDHHCDLLYCLYCVLFGQSNHLKMTSVQQQILITKRSPCNQECRSSDSQTPGCAAQTPNTPCRLRMWFSLLELPFMECNQNKLSSSR